MRNRHNGFTIIEIALVLVIAGLIFAAVFAVLPSVRANERDVERKKAVLDFVSNLKKFQTNSSRGALPGSQDENDQLYGKATSKGYITAFDGKKGGIKMGDLALGEEAKNRRSESESDKKATETSWMGFYRDYFGDSFQDPDGEYYNFAVMMCSNNSNITVGSDCDNYGGYNHNYRNALEKSFQDNDYTMYMVESAICDGDHPVYSANARRMAIVYRLERAGTYCENT